MDEDLEEVEGESQEQCNYFLLMIGRDGLEGLEDITEGRPELWDALYDLSGEENPKAKINQRISNTINFMLLRARFNNHREIEVYGLRTSPEVTADNIWGMFEADPEAAAKLIKQKAVLVRV